MTRPQGQSRSAALFAIHRARSIGGAAIVFFLGIMPSLGGAEEGWVHWLNPELRQLERERIALVHELDTLGVPAVGHTAAEYGYQHPFSKAPPNDSVWMQIDLGKRQAIDYIALIPTLSNWGSYEHKGYGFPRRLRVDASDDPGFSTFVSLWNFTDRDFPNPGVAPVVISGSGQEARYVRITVTKMAFENDRYFYALAEIMVVSGNLNVAIRRPVQLSDDVTRLPAWKAANVVDGRSPLGPPIRNEFIQREGFFIFIDEGTQPEITLDLGQVHALQQIRLHPVHMRNNSDTPGACFPLGFRIEAALAADFSDAAVLYNNNEFSNPGNNPVTITGRDTPARYVRVVATVPQKRMVGLSEIQVYAGNRNVAEDAAITATPDRADRMGLERWPESLLKDGFTSYGRLLELPEWLRGWERRRELNAGLARIEQRKATAVELARQRAVWGASTGAGLGLAAIASLLAASKHKRERELRELRSRLARDLHDEIGSNLAGIAALSELAGADHLPEAARQGHLSEIRRAARETNAAMREVLWLVGGREEAGADLIAHLRLAAGRVLAGKEIHWNTPAQALPPECTGETARQVFLVCKEALTNIARHSEATRVDISVQQHGDGLAFEIADNGFGFDPAAARGGLGLASQQSRIAALGGAMEIESRHGGGTRLRFHLPMGLRRRSRFSRFTSSVHHIFYACRLAHRG